MHFSSRCATDDLQDGGGGRRNRNVLLLRRCSEINVIKKGSQRKPKAIKNRIERVAASTCYKLQLDEVHNVISFLLLIVMMRIMRWKERDQRRESLTYIDSDFSTSFSLFGGERGDEIMSKLW